MSVANRVLKNSSLLIIASVINNVMTFILTLFTARYLGTYDYGLLSSATSFVGLFGIFCDLGLSTYAIREVSRDKSLLSKYFGTVFVIRVILSIVTFIIYMFFIWISNFTYDGTVVMLLLGIYMIFNSLTLANYSMFQSNEKMQYQTIGNVIYSVSVLLIILYIIHEKCNVIIVALGYPIAITLSFIYTVYITYKHYPRLTISLDKSFMKNLFAKGIPFGITSIFTSVYFWIALIILTYTASSDAVGLFSSSQKLLLVVSAIAYLVSNAIFPVMSELYTQNIEKLRGLYYKILKFLLILGIPMVLIASLYASDIINLIYGSEYVVGSTALSILIFAGVFMLLSNISSTLLGAINKQTVATKISCIGAIFSIIVNLLLIMKYSYIGASYATVLTEFLILFMMLIHLHNTEFKITIRECISPITRIIITNIIMIVVILVLDLSFWPAVIIGCVINVICLFLTGAINNEDKDIIFGFVNTILSKFTNS
ncbi:MAG: flippase [Methanosphaera sp.]|nr:flippase [Methanosphaera sp.]